MRLCKPLGVYKECSPLYVIVEGLEPKCSETKKLHSFSSTDEWDQKEKINTMMSSTTSKVKEQRLEKFVS